MESSHTGAGTPSVADTVLKSGYGIKGITYSRPTIIYRDGSIEISRYYTIITARFYENFENWVKVNTAIARLGLKTNVIQRSKGIIKLRVLPNPPTLDRVAGFVEAA